MVNLRLRYDSLGKLWKYLLLIYYTIIFFAFLKPLQNSIFNPDITFPEAIATYDFSNIECWFIVLFLLSGLMIVLSYYLYKRKALIRRHVPEWIPILCFLFLLFYFFAFRNDSHFYDGVNYQFLNLKNLTTFKFIDFLLFTFVINGIYFGARFKVQGNRIDTNKTSFWENDIPIDILDDQNDQFGRKRFAEKVAEQINIYSDERNSISIGIIGSWGTGKSTFLKHLCHVLTKSDENIVFNFNPWQYSSEINLSEVFLEELNSRLKNYSRKKGFINHYIRNLFVSNSTSWTVLVNILYPKKNIDTVKDIIRESIKDSQKRFIVIIDDIDRLQGTEILEVLTMIRNIGDLPNTIFILAYDKEYIIEELNKKISTKGESFLSKFFQVEFTLSNILNNTLQDDIIDRINNDPSFDNIKKSIEKLSSADAGEFEDVEKLVRNLDGIKLLKNKRDIIKLMNGIRFIWPLHNNQLDFRDFLNLEILRLKYNNVYSRIKSLDRSIFEKENVRFYHLKEDADPYSLNKELKNDVENYNDRSTVVKVLRSLFPTFSQSRESVYDLMEVKPNKAAVCNVVRFDLYFKNEFRDTAHIDFDDITRQRQDE